MECIISRAKLGDEENLAYIQTESWKAAFENILSDEALQQCTQVDKVTNMYRRLLEQNIYNGYLLSVDGTPHCIAWWGASRDKDMPDSAELICIHSLPDRWRRGFGKRMMEVVLGDIKKAQYTKVFLWVFEENVRARRFYEAMGFMPNGKAKTIMGTVEICYEMICATEDL